MIRRKCHYLIIILLCSCTMKKHMIPATAFDMVTGDKIINKGISLKKGKVCYIYTTSYEGQLPDMGIFKNISNSNSIPTMLNADSFLGSASSSSKADTVINNDLIVQIALQETINNNLPGFQYQFVPNEEFIDSTGKLNTDIIQKKYNPDIIINLTELSVKISGKTSKGTTVMVSQPMMEIPGEYSSVSPETNFSGNIFMDYTATWEVLNLKENKEKKIRQNGRYISGYNDKYSLYTEMIASAKKIGKEFSSLISESKN